jgi:hypothetical protein
MSESGPSSHVPDHAAPSPWPTPAAPTAAPPVPDAGPAPTRPVHLVSAEVPADQGLPALGLLLQLFGGLSTALACVSGAMVLLNPVPRGLLALLLLFGLSIARGLMHRGAGTDLLYGAQPLRGIYRYAAVAAMHSAAVVLLAVSSWDVSLPRALAGAAALMIWPTLLVIAARTPRLRRFADGLPTSEDKGFEGAAVLMVALGAAGLGPLLMAGYGLLRDDAAMSGTGALLVLGVLLLAIRSVLHLRAGVTGLRSRSLDDVVERVAAYANLGLISALVIGGGLLFGLIALVNGMAALPAAAVCGWALALWPTILRRFFADRQFGSFMAGDNAPVHRRAPDAGLTAMGWLMVGTGAALLSAAAFLLVGGVSLELTRVLDRVLGGGWLRPLLTGALSLGIGWELVRMGRHHRAIATAGAVALLLIEVAAFSADPGARHGSAMWLSLMTPGPALFSLTLLLLLRRPIAPMAHVVARS